MKGSIDVIADINEVPHEGDKEAFNARKITRDAGIGAMDGNSI